MPDTVVVVVAVVVAVSVLTRSPWFGLIGAVIASVIQRSGWIAVAVVGLAVLGAARSHVEWARLVPTELGLYEGWVRVVDDPQPYARSTRVIVDVDGQRYEIWERGRARQLRVREWRGGQWMFVHATRRPLGDGRAQRVAWQHVVGRLDVEWVADGDPGGPLERASNRVRAAIERAAEALPEPDGALFRGLVIGDDRDQPPEMIDRFRASGLSHLTAVSGQNVAFVLAACGPLLTRLRSAARLAATVAIIAWFVALTRFEPSILRAGVMASMAAFATATGRERAPLRLLSLAVIALLLVDPLLGWSIGFWLSVGATAGVCTVGPWLALRFARLGVLAMPLGITLGAQVGVALPQVLVFKQLPIMSVPANLLAGPVAGAVMLYGLPAGLLAGVVTPLAPVLMLPARFGTRWVDTVAELGARLDPAPAWSWLGWMSIGTVVALLAARRPARPAGERDDESPIVR